MENLLIPSAIQRIRSFLVEMCGMKVKPWAATEETLAALHTTLLARHGCQIFWASLRGLLETLARDLKARQAASPGSLVDNELLDSGRYATLLDEIRSALAQQSTAPASFRRLATALSAPALGLLLFLGGAVSVGCDRTGLPGQDAGVVDAKVPASQPDASSFVAIPDSAVPPPAPVDARIAHPEANPDGLILVTLPDASPAPVDARVAQTETDRDLPPTIAPDARPATDVAVPSSPDGAAVTIQDIMDICNISTPLQQQVLACLAKLGDSWPGPLSSGINCSALESDLYCFTQWRGFCGGVFDIKFPSDPNAPWTCAPIPVYLGVRFV